jgi:isoleucyl-tRNA synthetase
MLRTLGVLLAPILSFTAEEAWQFVPERLRGAHESIFDVPFPRIAEVDTGALALWQTLKDLRAQVGAKTDRPTLELDARVRAPHGQLEALRALGEGLREALIVSTLQ